MNIKAKFLKYRVATPMLTMLVFYFIFWLSHLFLISVISFFHFLLEHRLGIIEDWIFYQGWEIVMISKGFAFFIIVKFLTIRVDFKISLTRLLKQHLSIIPVHMFILSFAMLFSFLLWMRPGLSPESNFYPLRMVVCYFGNILFFGTDLLILWILGLIELNKSNSLDKHSKRELFSWKMALVPLMLAAFPYLAAKWIFLYETNINVLIMFWAYFICLPLQIDMSSPSPSLFILAAVVAPLNSLIGLDPLWGHNFSPFLASEAIDLRILFGLAICFSSYFYYRFFWAAEPVVEV